MLDTVSIDTSFYQLKINTAKYELLRRVFCSVFKFSRNIRVQVFWNIIVWWYQKVHFYTDSENGLMPMISVSVSFCLSVTFSDTIAILSSYVIR